MGECFPGLNLQGVVVRYTHAFHQIPHLEISLLRVLRERTESLSQSGVPPHKRLEAGEW